MQSHGNQRNIRLYQQQYLTQPLKAYKTLRPASCPIPAMDEQERAAYEAHRAKMRSAGRFFASVVRNTMIEDLRPEDPLPDFRVPDQIRPQLFLSSSAAEAYKHALDEAKITHVLQVGVCHELDVHVFKVAVPAASFDHRGCDSSTASSITHASCDKDQRVQPNATADTRLRNKRLCFC